jgi:hypothetical protein
MLKIKFQRKKSKKSKLLKKFQLLNPSNLLLRMRNQLLLRRSLLRRSLLRLRRNLLSRQRRKLLR